MHSAKVPVSRCEPIMDANPTPGELCVIEIACEVGEHEFPGGIAPIVTIDAVRSQEWLHRILPRPGPRYAGGESAAQQNRKHGRIASTEMAGRVLIIKPILSRRRRGCESAAVVEVARAQLEIEERPVERFGGDASFYRVLLVDGRELK